MDMIKSLRYKIERKNGKLEKFDPKFQRLFIEIKTDAFENLSKYI